MPSSAPRTRSRNLQIIIAAVIVIVAVTVWATLAVINASRGDGPIQSTLPENTSMGVLELNVADLDLMRGYYEEAVGFTVFSENDDEVVLGHDIPLLKLVLNSSGQSQSSFNEAGLYHSAILLPNVQTLPPCY